MVNKSTFFGFVLTLFDQVRRHFRTQRQVGIQVLPSHNDFCDTLPSLIIFRGPRISNTPAAARSPPPALSSSMRVESDGGVLDTAYEITDVADGSQPLLPYFHNPATRSNSSNEQLSFMESHMHPDPRIPLVTHSSLHQPNETIHKHSYFIYAAVALLGISRFVSFSRRLSTYSISKAVAAATPTVVLLLLKTQNFISTPAQVATQTSCSPPRMKTYSSA
jgi:hypothetical protein